MGIVFAEQMPPTQKITIRAKCLVRGIKLQWACPGNTKGLRREVACKWAHAFHEISPATPAGGPQKSRY
jgi:hypothetical protein